MVSFPIYLDNHSTTKVDPIVLESMLPYFTEHYGNASSKSHELGWKAEAAVTYARKLAARLVKCEPRDIIFTSGATESVNLAIKGTAEANFSKGSHIITTKIEHEAVLDSCRNLEKRGFTVTYLDVEENGIVSVEKIAKEISPQTILVSVMWVNNEIGTIQPVNEISKLCRQKKVLFHTDATQAAGKLKIDLSKLNVDLLSFSSHKMYGPKGVGALYKSGRIPRVRIVPQTDGGAQEKGLRAGTLNVPGIVGFGKACEIADTVLVNESARVKLLRDKLFSGLSTAIDGIKINGDLQNRIPGNLNVSIEGIDADSLMVSMKEVAVSTGSACSSEDVKPSHVLSAIGLNKELTRSVIRFGIGRFNTEEEIDYVVSKLPENVKKLRKNSPLNKQGSNGNSKLKKGDYAEI